MKSLYEFIARNLGLINVYYLSQDITPNDALDDNNFALFLYKNDILTTDVEFQVEEDVDYFADKPTFFVIKPAESTMVFGSYKLPLEIAEILKKQSGIDFAISQLEVSKNKISNLWVNNYNHGEQANEIIKKAVAEKDGKPGSTQKRQQELMDYPPKGKKIIHVQKIRH